MRPGEEPALRLGWLDTFRELSGARISTLWGQISGWGLIAIALGMCLGATTWVVHSSWVGYAAGAAFFVAIIDLIVTTWLEWRKDRAERLRQRSERLGQGQTRRNGRDAPWYR